MTTGQALQRGQIVLIRFPFTDLTDAKLRPALIVGRVSGEDLILAFITSQTANPASPTECLVESTDQEFRGTGLKAPSLVRLDKLATLHRALIRRRLGAVGPGLQSRIDTSLRYVLDL